MEKKGISPLIATVLLIGFTIVLAAVVMRWGGEFVRETTEETACQADIATACINTRFNLDNIENSTATGPGTATVRISSTSDNVIDGFRLILWAGSETDNSIEVPTVLESFESSSYDITYTDWAVITRVEAFPIITVEGCEKGTCSESGMEYEV